MHEISSPSRGVPKIGLGKEFVWKHRWLPKAVAAVSWLLFLTAFFWRRSEPLVLVSAATALLCSYAWGYSDRAFRLFFSPALTQLKRDQYADVWDSLAATRELATVSACGEREETGVRSSVESCVRNLQDLARISAQDEVLEIGCGVGRVGRELATHCKSWTGCDVSARMLAYAEERLTGKDNTRLVRLRRGGLRVHVEFRVGHRRRRLEPPRPGHHDVRDEERHGDVVEERGARMIRPELVGRPEEERRCERARLHELEQRHAPNQSLKDADDRDRRERSRGQRIVRPGPERRRRSVPREQGRQRRDGDHHGRAKERLPRRGRIGHGPPLPARE